jgi:lipoprotein-releasing system ATP-binding protein
VEQLNSLPEKWVAIARDLADDPPIILVDEPTGNLDTRAGANVRQILHDLTRDMGKTVIAVTHDLTFAKATDRYRGRPDRSRLAGVTTICGNSLMKHCVSYCVSF